MNLPDDRSDSVGYYRRMQAAVEELLVLRGVLSQEGIDRQVEAMDARNYKLGARVVARAWTDAAYRARLIADPRTAIEELGINIGPTHLIIVVVSPVLRNVIVCTLCSCYPRMLLGVPPQWYKSREYRSRVVREPRAVLAEFGSSVADDIDIRVHDSTADMRYMVLPLRPAGTGHLDEAGLAELVTRDSLIGVGLPGVMPDPSADT